MRHGLRSSAAAGGKRRKGGDQEKEMRQDGSVRPGDLHLSFQVHKPMDGFGRVWKRHEQKIERNVRETVKPEDTLVLTGDHSWGRKLAECREDLAFIERLPGRKILLRGNHDMFWDAKRTPALNAEYAGRLFFLQNNFAVYQDYALVGTKGYTFEGPFYLDRLGRIIGWEEEREAQAQKLVDREMARLRESFRQAEAAGYRKFILFLHYPPTNILEETSPFTRIAEEYGVTAVVYSHCHGESRFGDSIRGAFHGVRYLLVSGDYLRFPAGAGAAVGDRRRCCGRPTVLPRKTGGAAAEGPQCCRGRLGGRLPAF